MTPTTTTVLVPDTGEVPHLLGQAEELLLGLARSEDPELVGGAPYTLPEPLARRVALRALQRVSTAVRSRLHGEDAGPRQYGPDREHTPLRLVELNPTDITTLDAAWVALLHPRGDLADVLDALDHDTEPVAPHGPHPPPEVAGRAAVRAIAQLLRITAANHPCAGLTAHPLIAALEPQRAGRGDVTFSAAQDAAYVSMARLIVAALGGTALDAWAY